MLSVDARVARPTDIFPTRCAAVVRCKGCGRFRPSELASSTDPPSCPQCQGTALIIGGSAHVSGKGTVTALPTLLPGDQGQGWDRRWQDIQDEAANLLQPLTTQMSGQAIQAARQRVQDFYVAAYHLKDDLKRSSAVIGVPGKAVEHAVSGDADLALLADLANLRKHGQLSQPPRSGHVPKELSRAGTYLPGTPSPGWRLNLVIEHNGVALDGLDLVRRSVDAWRRILHGWNLT